MVAKVGNLIDINNKMHGYFFIIRAFRYLFYDKLLLFSALFGTFSRFLRL